MQVLLLQAIREQNCKLPWSKKIFHLKNIKTEHFLLQFWQRWLLPNVDFRLENCPWSKTIFQGFQMIVPDCSNKSWKNNGERISACPQGTQRSCYWKRRTSDKGDQKEFLGKYHFKEQRWGRIYYHRYQGTNNKCEEINLRNNGKFKTWNNSVNVL